MCGALRENLFGRRRAPLKSGKSLVEASPVESASEPDAEHAAS